MTCCFPEGSPLQGKSFVIGPEGATLGRKASNNIGFLVKVVEEKEDGTTMETVHNADTAISSEHARIEFDSQSGSFFICDGTLQKGSLNGTWVRLSGPHQESPPHILKEGTEVLIGTVRFIVKESMTISEHKVESCQNSVSSKTSSYSANRKKDELHQSDETNSSQNDSKTNYK